MPRRAFGTGSIYQSNTGYWFAAIYVGSKKVRQRCHTREDAETALAEMIHNHRNEIGRFYHIARTGQWVRAARPGEPWYVESRPRSGVTVAVRFAVLERDGFRCSYCGATPETAHLTVDHVVPVVHGGTDDMDNLTTACQPCNAGKAGRRLRVLPDQLAG